jgi:chemotaxis receptor (MCP) glutamine deamidase CheD
MAPGVDEHYGLYLMELLINEMMAKGARKSKLKAHLYGGANVNRNMMKIGTVNAEFARRFLKDEGIVLMREDLGGTRPAASISAPLRVRSASARWKTGSSRATHRSSRQGAGRCRFFLNGKASTA